MRSLSGRSLLMLELGKTLARMFLVIKSIYLAINVLVHVLLAGDLLSELELADLDSVYAYVLHYLLMSNLLLISFSSYIFFI